MESRASVFTAVTTTVVALLFGVPLGKSVAGRSDAAARTTARREQQAPAAASVGAPATRARHGIALLREYAAGGVAAAQTASCPTQGMVEHSLVAILPDPLDSHLDWAFDSGIESLRRALEHKGFLLDRYWLPWAQDADSTNRASSGVAPLRDAAPGVLLFRSAEARDSAVAMVYLVGETPTRGIQAPAFQAALADRDSLERCGRLAPEVARELRIVGPVFSGSARSIRLALEARTGPAARRDVSIISGGATVNTNAAELRCPRRGADCAKTPRVHFAATVNAVDVLKRAIDSLLVDRLHLERREIAYLTESGTQYGRGLSAPHELHDTLPHADTLPLTIPFPMNISKLRREYLRQLVASDTIGRGAGASRTRLEWRDPAFASETPGAFSEITAPTIERTIADIESTLRLHHIRAIGVLATDVRDRLFLATVIKQHFRDIQLFLIGSHSLYLRPELNEDLRGALVVSTYPLFLENQYWDLAQNRGRERMVFTSDASQGTYNAALAQLGDTADMLDYAYPLQQREPTGVHVPPIWVTVVGANAMEPLVAIDRRLTAAGRDTSYLVPRDATLPTRRHAESTSRSNEVHFMAVALTVFFLFAYWLHAHGTRLGPDRILSRMQWMRRRTGEDRVPPPTPAERRVVLSDATQKEWHDQRELLMAHRLAWLVFRFIALLCAFAPLMMILFRPQAHGSDRSIVGAVIFLAGMLLVIVGAISLWIRLRRLEGRGMLPDRWRGQLLGLFGIGGLYLVVTIVWSVQIIVLDRSRAAPLFTRMLQLDSGVTPLVPLLLGAAVLIVWSTAHLRRVRFLGDMSAFETACSGGLVDASALIPTISMTPAHGSIAQSSHPIDSPIFPLGTGDQFRRCVGDVRSALIRLGPRRDATAAMVGLGLLAAWLVLHSGRTIETIVLPSLPYLPSTFDLLFGALVFAALMLTGWGLFRITAAWAALRRCLRNVDAMPLGAAFDRLPATIASLARLTPFDAPHHSAVNLLIDRAARARWIEVRDGSTDPTLQTLLRTAPWTGRTDTFPSVRSESGAFNLTVAEPFVVLHDALCRAAAVDATYLDAVAGPHRSGAGAAGGLATPASAASRLGWVGAAQELVALYVIDYIEWVVGHLRDLALFLLIALGLTTMLLASYPFEPSSLVKIVFFGLMALSVLSIATILFQMNRNPTLSRLAHTDEGKVTWDSRFVLNLVLVAGLPLVTALSAQFPEIREFFFSWVTPALRALGR